MGSLFCSAAVLLFGAGTEVAQDSQTPKRKDDCWRFAALLDARWVSVQRVNVAAA